MNELGVYFKTTRILKNMSKKEVCANANISRQYLSKIEDTKEYFSINNKMCKRLQNALNANLIQDKKFYDKFEKISSLFVTHVLQGNDEVAYKAYRELRKDVNEIYNTTYLPNYLLIEYIHAVIYNDVFQDYDFLNDVLIKIHNQFNVRNMHLYFLFNAIYCYKNNKLDQALEKFMLLKELHYEPCLNAFKEYYLALLNLRLGCNLDAINCLTNAKNIFDKSYNTKRSLQCLNALTKVYIQLNEYHYAITNCNKVEKTLTFHQNHELYNDNLENYVLSTIYLEEYDKALQCIEEKYVYNNNPMFLLYVEFLCMKTNRSPKCLNELRSTDYTHKLTNVVVNLTNKIRKINKNKKDCEKLYLKCVEIISKNTFIDRNFLKILYRELVIFYKNDRNYNLALYYYEKYTN